MSKTFYCVTSGMPGNKRNPNLLLLKQACDDAGIDFVVMPVPANGFMYADIPVLEDGCVYVLNTQSFCLEYAYALLLRNPHLTSIYTTPPSIHSTWWELLADEAAGVPIIPTLYALPVMQDEELYAKIDSELGGFPIVVKKAGGSHGTGIIFIESRSSLKTVMPHLNRGNRTSEYVFKKYVHKARNFRAVVLDGKLVTATEYLLEEGDIRSNAMSVPLVRETVLEPAWQEAAERAVVTKGVRFGGADILVAEDGTHYIAEVNTPCNFSRSQHFTGDPIAQRLVAALCID